VFLQEVIFTIQNNLFDLGAEISLSQIYIESENVDWLEHKLDALNESLPPLKEFILPGGNEQASLCHLSRSICRRAERSLVSLNKDKKISPDLMAYINRLSDFLFVLARTLARQNGDTEIYWKPGKLTDD
jgi:cob(I)alamin adenosyltransferase